MLQLNTAMKILFRDMWKFQTIHYAPLRPNELRGVLPDHAYTSSPKQVAEFNSDHSCADLTNIPCESPQIKSKSVVQHVYAYGVSPTETADQEDLTGSKTRNLSNYKSEVSKDNSKIYDFQFNNVNSDH